MRSFGFPGLLAAAAAMSAVGVGPSAPSAKPASTRRPPAPSAKPASTRRPPAPSAKPASTRRPVYGATGRDAGLIFRQPNLATFESAKPMTKRRRRRLRGRGGA